MATRKNKKNSRNSRKRLHGGLFNSVKTALGLGSVAREFHRKEAPRSGSVAKTNYVFGCKSPTGNTIVTNKSPVTIPHNKWNTVCPPTYTLIVPKLNSLPAPQLQQMGKQAKNTRRKSPATTNTISELVHTAPVITGNHSLPSRSNQTVVVHNAPPSLLNVNTQHSIGNVHDPHTVTLEPNVQVTPNLYFGPNHPHNTLKNLNRELFIAKKNSTKGSKVQNLEQRRRILLRQYPHLINSHHREHSPAKPFIHLG
jgi:hypothetical protein